MLINTESYARAGLVGNPSDGYFGKTISFIIRNFSARVTLYETPQLEIIPNERDHSLFDGISQLAKDVDYFGYYGGIRLLKATIRRFYSYCIRTGVPLHDRNFTIRYSSNIPPQVGMAGSSAIITACLKALMEFYEVSIPKPIQANFILEVETKELSIPAGLQDRVIQAYEGCVFMDFDREVMRSRGYGTYEELDPNSLPDLYVAFSTQLSEGTEIFHNDIKGRFNRGDELVVDAMREWAAMAQEVRNLLVAGRGREIGPILDANFDLRRKIYQMSEGNIAMVEAARSVGATAKFTGSGGAIVGTYEDEEMFRALRKKLSKMGLMVFKPAILPEDLERLKETIVEADS